MVNQRVLFGGYDTTGAYGLWSSDGTATGTTELAPANAGVYGVAPGSVVQLGTVVLFAGVDAQGNTGLWTTDGTALGTAELAIAGASATFGGFEPGNFAVLGKLALFSGYNAANVNGLWSTDGTAANTKPLAVANAANTGLTPTGMTTLGAAVYFQGVDAAGRVDLWKTNGTSTVAVAVAGAAASGLAPTNLTPFGTYLLFSGTDAAGATGLWVSNGIASGTQELKPAGANAAGLQPGQIAVLGAKALFSGLDAAGNDGLWSTDGTAANTTELAVAGAFGLGLTPQYLTVFGGKLLFSGTDAAGNQNLWVSDGTAVGTKELSVAGAGPAGLQPAGFSVLGNEVLFSGHDSNDLVQLWETDGTAGGTKELAVAGASSFGLVPTGLTTVKFPPPNPLHILAATAPSAQNGQTIVIGTLTGFTAGDTLTVKLTGDSLIASGSTVSISAAGQVSYTPGLIGLAQVGNDAIRYTVTDTTLADSVSGSALVALSNGPAPTVTAASQPRVANAGSTQIGTATPGHAGDPLGIVMTSDQNEASGSSLSIGAGGAIIYTAGLITLANAGPDKVGYTVTDTATGAASSGFLFLTLSAGPQPTIKLAATPVVANGQTGVLATITTVYPTDPISVKLTADTSFATGSSLAVGAGNSIVYTPGLITASTVTADTVSFVVTDTLTGSAVNGSARVTLSNGPAPTITPGGSNIKVYGGVAQTIATAVPVFAADPLAVVLTKDTSFATGSAMSVDAAGHILYTPGAIATPANDTLTYMVRDTITGASATRSQVVALTPGAPPALAAASVWPTPVAPLHHW